jgi:hypothetical protein
MVTTTLRASCSALEAPREQLATTPFERPFREPCLAFAIRSDIGVPIASPNSFHEFNIERPHEAFDVEMP